MASSGIKPEGQGVVLFDDKSGTKEIILPLGVYAEVLSSSADLKDNIPTLLEEFIKKKGCEQEYKHLINEILAEKASKKTKFDGTFASKELINILGTHDDLFEAKGVLLGVCFTTSDSRNKVRLWLEFQDADLFKEDYISPNDIRRITEESDKVKTLYQKIKLPKGVCCEKLSSYRMSRLEKECPRMLQDLLKKNDAQAVYDNFIEAIMTKGVKGKHFRRWKSRRIMDVVEEFRAHFAVKNIDLYYSRKDEWVQHGQSGHTEHFRWLEFADTTEIQDYRPKYCYEDRKYDQCIVM